MYFGRDDHYYTFGGYKMQTELVCENSKLCSESLVTGFSWGAPSIPPAELWTLMKSQHRDRKST